MAKNIKLDDKSLKVIGKAYYRLSKKWRLEEDLARRLGGMNGEVWGKIKNGEDKTGLTGHQAYRLMIMISLYERLHCYFGNPDLADRWPTLSHNSVTFSGNSPVDLMLEEGEDGMEKTLDYVDGMLARG